MEDNVTTTCCASFSIVKLCSARLEAAAPEGLSTVVAASDRVVPCGMNLELRGSLVLLVETRRGSVIESAYAGKAARLFYTQLQSLAHWQQLGTVLPQPNCDFAASLLHYK